VSTEAIFSGPVSDAVGPPSLIRCVRVEADAAELAQFIASASVYWRSNLPPPNADACVIVEAFHEDLRVNLRNLTIANAVRRVTPARLLVLTGLDPDWREALSMEFDTSLVGRVAEAYGAADVLDVHGLADARMLCPDGHDAPNAELDEVAYATLCRLRRVPRLGAADRTGPEFARRRRRAAVLASIYDEVLGDGSAVALVTSHVDYDQWGLAVRAARRAGVPVVHTQTTGSLKAYALFPEAAVGERTFRAELTGQIGAWFQEQVWPRRAELHESAELVTWRSKRNLGRPSWWRGGAVASLDLRTSVERAQLRVLAAARFGLDPKRPVAVVFNHAVSDALGTNREVFGDLAEWFERTAAHARSTASVNWIFIDHPKQHLYDQSGFFDRVAADYAGQPHMVFRPSAAVSKNILWSLADLGVTVRGSVSNELPAFGIPMIQAGWSEWSGCGLSAVADGPDAYWRLLDATLAEVAAGRPVITAEQVERARLWLWVYRAAADVVSPLVPHWEQWPAPHLLYSIGTHMRHVESDREPIFEAVARMWRRREPLLTRFDLSAVGDPPIGPSPRVPAHSREAHHDRAAIMV
jgi:hypothetical protein